jgi:hypothetical protein
MMLAGCRRNTFGNRSAFNCTGYAAHIHCQAGPQRVEGDTMPEITDDEPNLPSLK